MSDPTHAATEPIRFSAYPLAWLSIAFAAGIAIAGLVNIDWKSILIASIVFALVSFVVRGSSSAVYALAGAFFCLGAFCYQFEIASVRDSRIKRIYDEGRIQSGSPVEVEGVMLGPPEPAYDGALIRLRVASLVHKQIGQNVSGVVRLFVPLNDRESANELDSLDLRSGTRIRVAGELARENQFLNPGVILRLRILDQQGIDAVATVKSPLLIEKIDDSNWSPFDLVYNQRRWLIDEFRARFSPSTAGVMIASLLGDKYFLDKDTADVFRDGGTFHVLVISGLHITFIGGLLLWIVSFFTKNRWWQFAILSGSLWSYTLAVGAEVPVVRASIMFSVFLISRAVYRDASLLNSLGLCCLILLAWRPGDLFNPSFQLTVVSVVAIVTMGFPLIAKLRSIGSWMPDAVAPFPPNVPDKLRRFCEMLYWNEAVWQIESERQIWSARIFKQPYFAGKFSQTIRKLAAFIFEGVLVSFIVQLWMLPLLVYYFHRVSPVSILLNLWVGLIIAFESFAALITVFFGQIDNVFAYPFAIVTEILNWLLLIVPRTFVETDWASFRVPIYSGAFKSIYLLYLIPVAVIAFVLYRWDPFELRRDNKVRFGLFVFAGPATAIFGFLIIFHPMSTPHSDGKLHVEFLDVGQGDSAFITFPNGETILIDAGGRINYKDSDEDTESFEPDVPRIGEMVVSEFLWEKGYSRVDYIVATHADADHVQGLADIARNFNVDTIYFGTMPNGASEMDELLKQADRNGIEPKRIGRGDNIEIGGAKIEVLWPIKGDENMVSDNNGSLVMRLIYGEHSFLFTGDIEREAEAMLVSNGTILNAMVVKVPHHGSRTSSITGFVDAVKARTAVISVGRRSMFGHPHGEVVKRWEMAGADVLRTGEKGTVSITSDGKRMEIGTFLP
jgi:competence protein ComEC